MKFGTRAKPLSFPTLQPSSVYPHRHWDSSSDLIFKIIAVLPLLAPHYPLKSLPLYSSTFNTSIISLCLSNFSFPSSLFLSLSSLIVMHGLRMAMAAVSQDGGQNVPYSRTQLCQVSRINDNIRYAEECIVFHTVSVMGLHCWHNSNRLRRQFR